MNKIILASASPRRKELLTQIGIPFEVRVSHVEEKIKDTHPEAVVESLAEQKAEAVFRETDKEALVIGADTIVVLDGRILGKPKSEEEAVEMLSALGIYGRLLPLQTERGRETEGISRGNEGYVLSDDKAGNRSLCQHKGLYGQSRQLRYPGSGCGVYKGDLRGLQQRGGSACGKSLPGA